MTGPFDPARGLRFNPAKLLLDPYARAIEGQVRFGPEVLGYDAEDPDRPSPLDSAAHMPRSLVVDPTFAWRDAPRPQHAYADTVLYEVHVKGFTAAHPAVPEPLRGTYAGLAHPAALAHLQTLGVTTVELLPGAPQRARGVPGRPRAHQLLGLQHHRLLRAARRLLGRGPRRTPRAARSPSSRRWSTRCTAQVSRSCSTWCSTTPPRATTAVRPCVTAGSTTPPTTGWIPGIRAATWTRPAAATRSTWRTRSPCR